MKDGHLNYCKICFNLKASENRVLHKERIKSYEKSRSSSQKRKDLNTTIVKQYRSKYPERYKANTALNNAVKTGKVIKTACFSCGNTSVVAHHSSYALPLDVIWLCQTCHKATHKLPL